MIELQHIQQAFRGISVLRDVSLTIAAGEHLLLTGPSGSGKSALLRIIAGLDAPVAGEVTLDGRTAVRGPVISIPPQRRGIAMVFQDLGLWPNLSALDNVLLGLAGETGSRAEKRRRAFAALDSCSLQDLPRRKPGLLSGGEQQRLALARAFVTRPRILLLDEPFASLDMIVRGEIFHLIRRKCRDEGITTLTVSHHPSDAFGLEVDRVAVLEEGRIAEQVTLETLRNGGATSPTLQSWRILGVSE